MPIQVRHRTPPRGPTAGGAVNATGAVDQFAWAGSSPLTVVVESTTSDRRLRQLVAHGSGVGVSGRRQQRRRVYVVPKLGCLLLGLVGQDMYVGKWKAMGKGAFG